MPYKTYSSDHSYQGPSRNLVVFLDGTWNDENGKDGDGVTTNVYRWFKSLKGSLDTSDVPFKKTHNSHLALYFRGVGNDEDNGLLGTFYEGAFGAGEKRIRDNAYTEILRNYRQGDRISIIGFSRGAACARLLASKLGEHGIMKSVRIYYKKNDNGETFFKKYKELDTTKHEVQVQFLGIFDTVGAFGIPINLPGLPFQKINLFKNLKVSNDIKKTVHCVGIDESREPFIPTLCNKSSRVEEVWFAGVHSDIGGGYKYAELGKITLKFMVDKLSKQLATEDLEYDSEELKKHTEYDLDSDELKMHYHGDGIKKYQRRIYVSVKDKESSFKPKVHSSVKKLIAAKNTHVAEGFDSFTTITRILYDPKNLRQLGNNIDYVD